MSHSSDAAAGPAPGRIQSIGLVARLLNDPLEGLLHARESFGDIVRLRPAPALNVFLLSDPASIRHVLVRNPGGYRKIRLYKWVDLAFGKGLFTSEGDLWVRQRRLLQPYFTKTGVQGFTRGIHAAICRKISDLEKKIDTGGIIDIEAEMLDATRQILIDTVLDEDVRSEVDAVRQQFIHAVSPSPVFGRLPIPGRVFRLKRSARALQGTMLEIIETRRQTPERGRDSLLTRLIVSPGDNARGDLQDRQLLDEMMTLIFTGDETSAQNLAWTWYLLSGSASAEARFHAEVDAWNLDPERIQENLERLTYTHAVVKESMRLYPPAWANARVALKEDRIAGQRIPVRSLVVYSQYVMHRHPAYWDHPEAFDPDRFSEPAGRPDFAYFPFGGGHRNCIGQHFALTSILLILALLGRRFRFRPVGDQAAEIEPNIALRPRGGLKMSVERR